jgi:ribosomal protein S18 acetylase RimI-like enzyme
LSGRIRLLGEADFDAVLDVQRSAGELPDGFLLPKSDDELRGFLDGSRGVACGVIEAGRLVAVSLLQVPSARRPNGGGVPFPLVPPADWPLRACFVQNTIVRPEARGRGHQRALFDARLAHARLAKMKWVCAGVHLENRASWANLLASGMVVGGIRFDPGYPVIGLALSFDPRALRTDPADAREIDARDGKAIEAATRSGYAGVRVAPGGALVFERRLGR